VQVAWAEGKVTEEERKTVLFIATERGVEPTSPAYARLEEWLRTRPSDELFDAAVAATKAGVDVLSVTEREDRVKRIVEACHKVAEASGGGGLARLVGLTSGVSIEEAAVLDAIAVKLRAHRRRYD
jgi:hypothetical protein